MNTPLSKKGFSLLFSFLLTFTFLISSTLHAENVKEKRISRSFNVDKNALLQVENRYGSIHITHWNKNEVSIEVIVEAKANSDKKAQETLDRVSVDFNQSGHRVSAKTNIKSISGNSGNISFNINYIIKMPAEIGLDLDMKYGNIQLPDNNPSSAYLKVKYGNITAGSFSQDLKVEAKYSNLTFKKIRDSKMDLGYCGEVKIEEANEMSIDSKYSNLNINTIKVLSIEKKYGNLQIDKINTLKIDVKYSEVNINRLQDKLLAGSLSYGTINIKELNSNFNQIRVSARYGNLNIGISTKASFRAEANNMKYGNLSVNGLNNFKMDQTDKNSKSHTMTINDGKNGFILFEGNNYSNLTINGLK